MKIFRSSFLPICLGGILIFPGQVALGQSAQPQSNPSNKTTGQGRAAAIKEAGEQKEVALKVLYPRSKSDIRKQLGIIARRKAPAGVSAQVQAAVNTLNGYRYLCGLYAEVKADAEFNAQALEAAKTCAMNNKIAHDLGGHTQSCNLYAGRGTLAASMHVYMNDPGDNNRKERGHRRNSLSYNLDAVGFGQEKDFSAMRVFGKGTRNEPATQGWSYPGRGYYPKEWMLGNGWSYYAPDGSSLADDVKVSMWKLSSSPKELIATDAAPKGQKIKLPPVFNHGSYIVFEPELPAKAKGKGIYWVRIESSGHSDQYVVELY